MSKISREDNKKRFKTGMYPTQQDFENVFDSYVHKDDTIDPSKIVSGKENIVDIINRKAEEKHSHEIKDVDGLQTFITEMTNLLEIVRDPETGEISQSKLKTLTDGIAALRDDIDTNTDNVAGHESRIQTNEAALEKVYQILGKDAKESIADLADRFTALSGNYANVYAFINKVKQFLEDADASDETINRWQEIETFLQGITDSETLTGLLQDLKAEILAEIPEPAQQGNYLKQIADLDGYTNAQDGEIVQYVGQTNENYTRGYIYERKVTEEKTYSAGIKIANFDNKNIVDNIVINGTFYEDSTLANQYGKSNDYYAKCKYQLKSNGDDTYTKEDCTKDIYFYRSSYSATEPLSYVIIDGVYHKLPAELQTVSLNSSTNKLYSGGSSYVYVPTADLWINIEDIKFSNSSGYFKNFINSEGDILQYDPAGSMWNDFHRGIYISKDGNYSAP